MLAVEVLVYIFQINCRKGCKLVKEWRSWTVQQRSEFASVVFVLWCQRSWCRKWNDWFYLLSGC